MRWIIAIFVILDVVYQLFGVSTSVNWSIFYEIYHYSAFMAICLFYYMIYRDKLLLAISGYFMYIVTIQIYNINQTREIYLSQIRQPEPMYNLSFCIIFILIIFIYGKYKR